MQKTYLAVAIAALLLTFWFSPDAQEVAAGVAYLAAASLPSHLTPLLAALVALPIAALAIISDLVESIIKRRAEAKDAGQTIPGIGGVFDLSDSLILTAPVGYVIFNLL